MLKMKRKLILGLQALQTKKQFKKKNKYFNTNSIIWRVYYNKRILCNVQPDMQNVGICVVSINFFVVGGGVKKGILDPRIPIICNSGLQTEQNISQLNNYKNIHNIYSFKHSEEQKYFQPLRLLQFWPYFLKRNSLFLNKSYIFPVQKKIMGHLIFMPQLF